MKSIDLNSDLGEGFGDYVMADDAGTSLEMEIDSILVHGDTAGALEIARGIRETAIEAGYAIRPFAS